MSGEAAGWERGSNVRLGSGRNITGSQGNCRFHPPAPRQQRYSSSDSLDPCRHLRSTPTSVRHLHNCTVYCAVCSHHTTTHHTTRFASSAKPTTSVSNSDARQTSKRGRASDLTTTQTYTLGRRLRRPEFAPVTPPHLNSPHHTSRSIHLLSSHFITRRHCTTHHSLLSLDRAKPHLTTPSEREKGH